MIFRKINYQEIRYEREQLKMLRDQLFSLRGEEKKNIQVIHDRCQDIITDKVVEEIRQIQSRIFQNPSQDFLYKHLKQIILQRCMIY